MKNEIEPFQKIGGKKEVLKWSEVKFDKEDYEVPNRSYRIAMNALNGMIEVLLYLLCDWAKGNGQNYYTMNHFTMIKHFLIGDIAMNVFQALVFLFVLRPGLNTGIRCIDVLSALVFIVFRLGFLPILGVSVY